jgi:hypothetical protein
VEERGRRIHDRSWNRQHWINAAQRARLLRRSSCMERSCVRSHHSGHRCYSTRHLVRPRWVNPVRRLGSPQAGQREIFLLGEANYCPPPTWNDCTASRVVSDIRRASGCPHGPETWHRNPGIGAQAPDHQRNSSSYRTRTRGPIRASQNAPQADRGLAAQIASTAT